MTLKPLSLSALALLLLVGACAKKEQPKAPPPPQAGFVVLKAESVPLEMELAGRTTAYEISDVRPQVSGVLLARHFEEGAIVRQGQTLYEIDPSLYEAAAAQARANLANSEAARVAAEARAERYKPLVAIEAVSKQDYADALAQAQQAAAQVRQNEAALKTAQINLRFTRVPAPISGRIGRSLVTTGALVTEGQTQALATIQRLDPIFVDIQQSSSELLALRQRLARGGATPASAAVRLVLEDGSIYPRPGRLEFAETLVDPTTGSVTLRARFPNPDNLLLPGMFVRARLAQAVATQAVLVPQQAVARNPRGEATIMVLAADNSVQQRVIKTDRTIGDKWLATSGVAAGDRVITEGLNRIRPGQKVHPVPAGSPNGAAPTGR